MLLPAIVLCLRVVRMVFFFGACVIVRQTTLRAAPSPPHPVVLVALDDALLPSCGRAGACALVVLREAHFVTVGWMCASPALMAR